MLNIGACKNHHIGKATDSIGKLEMIISKTLLIGTENIIKVAFQIDNEGNHINLSDFKLKVSILEQETFTGPTTGSQISYIGPSTDKKVLTMGSEKFLTEFTTLSELNSTHGQNGLTVDFDLLPAQDTIKVKLHFELFDKAGTSIQTQEVKWIKDAVVINSPTIFEGGETLIVLKSIEKDIRDLNKVIFQLKSDEEKVHFYFKSNGKSVATLVDLLGGASKMIIDKPTNPIEIAVDAENRAYSAKLAIMVFDANAIDESRPLGKHEVTWNDIKLAQKSDQDQEGLKKEQQGQNSKQETSQPQQQGVNKEAETGDSLKEEQQRQNSKQETSQPQQQGEQIAKELEDGPALEINQEVEKFKKVQEEAQEDKEKLDQVRQEGKILKNKIKQEVKEDKETHEKEQTDKQSLDQPKQEEIVLAKDLEEIESILKEEQKEIKTEKKNKLKALKKEERKELKAKKNREEKDSIREMYKKRRQAIKASAEAAEVDWIHKRDHSNGFMNALAHNMFGISLKAPKNDMYRKGQMAGHRAALILGRTETAFGGSVTGVGVVTLILGTGPSLGSATIGSAVLIGLGLFGVAHGIATSERAQANLATLKDAPSEKSNTSHEASHPVHIENHTTEEGSSTKVKSSEEKS
ncbi:hypothetical protein [Candidatus Amoebophilus asiaticus]|uniref:hypothetical protein n=1 Tax=Candidatus Amoebophilus asiaticus TaxID=281120 RepID=UPI0011D11704|nr:hypothetical protein [Candidatus Amoebophilus asiaticus]